jgi:hypothetical protein
MEINSGFFRKWKDLCTFDGIWPLAKHGRPLIYVFDKLSRDYRAELASSPQYTVPPQRVAELIIAQVECLRRGPLVVAVR